PHTALSPMDDFEQEEPTHAEPEARGSESESEHGHAWSRPQHAKGGESHPGHRGHATEDSDEAADAQDVEDVEGAEGVEGVEDVDDVEDLEDLEDLEAEKPGHGHGDHAGHSGPHAGHSGPHAGMRHPTHVKREDLDGGETGDADEHEENDD